MCPWLVLNLLCSPGWPLDPDSPDSKCLHLKSAGSTGVSQWTQQLLLVFWDTVLLCSQCWLNSLSSLSVLPKGWDPVNVLPCYPKAGKVWTAMLGSGILCVPPCLAGEILRVPPCLVATSLSHEAFKLQIPGLPGCQWRWTLPCGWWTEKAAQEQLLLLSEPRSQPCIILLTVLVLGIFFLSIWPGRS